MNLNRLAFVLWQSFYNGHYVCYTTAAKIFGLILNFSIHYTGAGVGQDSQNVQSACTKHINEGLVIDHVIVVYVSDAGENCACSQPNSITSLPETPVPHYQQYIMTPARKNCRFPITNPHCLSFILSRCSY